MWLWYLPVKYANIRIANFGSIIAVSDTCVATSNGSDILKESDISSVEFILFWKESYTLQFYDGFLCHRALCCVIVLTVCIAGVCLTQVCDAQRSGGGLEGGPWSQQDVSPSLSQSPWRDEASHLQRRPELGSGKFRVQRLPWSLEVLINVVISEQDHIVFYPFSLSFNLLPITMDPR